MFALIFFQICHNFFSLVCFRSCSIDFWQQECERALFKMTELYSAQARNLSPLHRHNLARERGFSICLFLNLIVVFGYIHLNMHYSYALDEFFCRLGNWVHSLQWSHRRSLCVHPRRSKGPNLLFWHGWPAKVLHRGSPKVGAYLSHFVIMWIDKYFL